PADVPHTLVFPNVHSTSYTGARAGRRKRLADAEFIRTAIRQLQGRTELCLPRRCCGLNLGPRATTQGTDQTKQGRVFPHRNLRTATIKTGLVQWSFPKK